jgi:hypothetical protein
LSERRLTRLGATPDFHHGLLRLHAVALVESKTLANRDPVAVFIGQTLAEARRVEDLLTQRGVDYSVQVELFGYTLLGSARYGAMFYVAVGQAQYCRSALVAAGLELGVIEKELERE